MNKLNEHYWRALKRTCPKQFECFQEWIFIYDEELGLIRFPENSWTQFLRLADCMQFGVFLQWMHSKGIEVDEIPLDPDSWQNVITSRLSYLERGLKSKKRSKFF